MFIYYLAKFSAYLGKIYMVLDKSSVLWMAKYWTISLAIWGTSLENAPHWNF